MDTFISKSGREFSYLPIDNKRGFPQTFPLSFNGKHYYFKLYVNIAAELLTEDVTYLNIPAERSYLVVQVEKENIDGTREVIFLRKVVPGLEYMKEDIILTFSQMQVARKNINGYGDFGSNLMGGIASRWA